MEPTNLRDPEHLHEPQNYALLLDQAIKLSVRKVSDLLMRCTMKLRLSMRGCLLDGADHADRKIRLSEHPRDGSTQTVLVIVDDNYAMIVTWSCGGSKPSTVTR